MNIAAITEKANWLRLLQERRSALEEYHAVGHGFQGRLSITAFGRCWDIEDQTLRDLVALKELANIKADISAMTRVTE